MALSSSSSAAPAGMEEPEFEPTIQNILDQHSLKWIFVGGKGGVGKTTCSCSLAIQLSKVRDKVLLVSTDPAHNLSDAFNQKFGPEPSPVNGFTNLYCMEIDPLQGIHENTEALLEGAGLDEESQAMARKLASSLPGIDEATSFAKVMGMVQKMDYNVTVFDTAPTGHTLRLLQMPEAFSAGLSQATKLKDMFGGMLGEMGSMFGLGNTEGLFEKAETMKSKVEEVGAMMRNPDVTTFVCVCIAEFLSLYETERLIQDLTKMDIDSHNIIVNQLLVPDLEHPCDMCTARSRIQGKYLQQIDDLYEDFHVIKVPLQKHEIRGSDALKAFSERLLQRLHIPKV